MASGIAIFGVGARLPLAIFKDKELLTGATTAATASPKLFGFEHVSRVGSFSSVMSTSLR